jgi:hypothetical protein
MKTMHITTLTKSCPTFFNLLGRTQCMTPSIKRIAHRTPNGVNRQINNFCTATGALLLPLRMQSKPMLEPDVLDQMPPSTCKGHAKIAGHGTPTIMLMMYSHCA